MASAATSRFESPGSGYGIVRSGFAALIAMTSSFVPAGGVSEVLFSEDFASGNADSLLTWGSPSPTVADDVLASNGQALRYQWQHGFENYNGAFRTLDGEHRVVHVRLRLRQDLAADNGGIQKIVRYRGNIDGIGDRAVGTFNFQWGSLLFFGDDFGNGNNHVQTLVASHGPDTFRGQYRYLETRLDYSDPTEQRFRAWVDGTLVIDGVVPLATVMPPSTRLEGVMFLGTFNDPADTRSDWIDDIVIATSYIGIDGPGNDLIFASGFDPK